MHSQLFLGLVSLSGLASIVQASPINKPRNPDGFVTTFLQSLNPNFSGVKLPGAFQLIKTYRKYGAENAMPEALAAIASGQTGTVTATPEQYDEEYLEIVSIGGQDLNLDFDTGSADL
jgi:hypothetical protein